VRPLVPVVSVATAGQRRDGRRVAIPARLWRRVEGGEDCRMTRAGSEALLQRQVVDLARWRGWGVAYRPQRGRASELDDEPLTGLVFHPRIMYRSEPGWPDLTLVRRRDRRLIFAELKAEDGKLTRRQERVLELLRCLQFDPMEYGGLLPAAPRIEVHVWRPADIERIAEILE
jgi:hypothetical protein